MEQLPGWVAYPSNNSKGAGWVASKTPAKAPFLRASCGVDTVGALSKMLSRSSAEVSGMQA